MYRSIDASTGAVIAERLRPAHTHWTRMKGLLGTRTLPAGDGLWLKPCRQVHMFGMRYPIDVVFLDASDRVLRTVSRLAPGRVSPNVREAASVLELPAGTIESTGIGDGTQLTITGSAGDTATAMDTIGAVAANLLLAALYLAFANAHLGPARASHLWMATLPIVAQETLLAAFFLTRRRSRATSDRLFDWLVAPVGTFLPFALRPTAVAGTWLPAGEWLQVAGATLAVAGLLSLGRSIGIVATNRGVKTAGMYRLVRHPMYVAYMVTYCGYILSFPSWRNGIIVITTVAALVARAIVEERLLANDPTYSDYTRQVRWRFVPLVY